MSTVSFEKVLSRLVLALVAANLVAAPLYADPETPPADTKAPITTPEPSATQPTKEQPTQTPPTAEQPTTTPPTTTEPPANPTTTPTSSPPKASPPITHAGPVQEPPPPAGFDAAVKLYNARKYSEAAAALQQFVKKGQANSDVHLYLGGTLQQLKKYDAALAEYDWVAKHARLISVQNKGKTAAHTLRCYRALICPNTCLKMSTPGWAHYPGLDQSVLWMKFSKPDGWTAWSTHHLGEVIVYENGMPVNKGKCPVCGGTGKVPMLK